MKRWLFLLSVLISSIHIAAQKPRLIIPFGHSAEIESARFSPDGSFIVSAGRDSTAIIWDVETAKQLYSLKGHRININIARISYDNSLVITCSDDSTARLWDLATGDSLSVIKHQNKVSHAFFFAYQNRFVTESNDSLFIWQWKDNQILLIEKFTGTEVDFNAKGFLYEHDKKLFVYKAETQIQTKVDIPEKELYRAYFLGNKYIILNQEVGKIDLYDQQTGSLIKSLTLKNTDLLNFPAYNEQLELLYYKPLTRVIKNNDTTWRYNDSLTIVDISNNISRNIKSPAGSYVYLINNDSLLITSADSYNSYIISVSKDTIIKTITGKLAKINNNTICSFWENELYLTKLNTSASYDLNTKAKSFGFNVNDPIFDFSFYKNDWNSDSAINRTAGYFNLNISGKDSITDFKQILDYDYCDINVPSTNDLEKKIKTLGITSQEQNKTYKVVYEEQYNRIIRVTDSKEIFAIKKQAADDNSRVFWIDETQNKFIVRKYLPSRGCQFDLYSISPLKKIDSISDPIPEFNKGGTRSYNFKTMYYDRTDGFYSSYYSWYVDTLVKLIYYFDINKYNWHLGINSVKIYNLKTKKITLYEKPQKIGNFITAFNNGNLVVLSDGFQHIISSIPQEYDYLLRFNIDNKLLLKSESKDEIRIWNFQNGKLEQSISPGIKNFHLVKNPSTEELIIISGEKILFYDKNYNVISEVSSSIIPFPSEATFFQKQNILILSRQGIASKSQTNPTDYVVVVNMKTHQYFYMFFLDENNWITMDRYGRFDGTDLARKTLYLTCGTEIIELNSIKNELWVDGLANRILSGDSIYAKTLDEMDICQRTPLVRLTEKTAGKYVYAIKPQRGGLGETILSVNGIQYLHYKPGDLTKKDGAYELVIKKQEIEKYFVSGSENKITVRAFTTDNTLSSRGLELSNTDTTLKNNTAPNLYAIMIGVSDYKGSGIDLKYAAKDADDLEAAVAAAARRWLNTDGKEHVFTYKLTADVNKKIAAVTNKFPEKKAIQQTLQEIGKKAETKDILLIFFAGHGVLRGIEDKKQFYFLTANASDLSVDDVKEVGISTAELSEWIKPQNLKAQKRIMIFDACNSGQLLNDFAGGALAVRSDDKSQQVKEIDRLNEKSGLFILSASASDQSAYEMSRYSQGLLTYCLLKTMKENPNILDKGKLLNVGNWFDKAKNEVENAITKIGGRQQPQMITNTNFNIGKVDSAVLAAIHLADEKPLFAKSEFRNKNTRTDNLRLRSLVDKELEDISARGDEVSIAFAPGYEGEDAYRLAGDYEVNGDEISADIVLIKGENAVANFMQKGNKNKPEELAAAIARKAAELAEKKK